MYQTCVLFQILLKTFFQVLPLSLLQFLCFAQLSTIVENFVDNLENAAILGAVQFFLLCFY